jgi:hypothetical protein
VSDFGDFDPDDALDTEPADPEQVARRLHAYRRDRGLEGRSFDELTLAQRAVVISIAAALLAWLRRQGALR